MGNEVSTKDLDYSDDKNWAHISGKKEGGGSFVPKEIEESMTIGWTGPEFKFKDPKLKCNLDSGCDAFYVHPTTEFVSFGDNADIGKDDLMGTIKNHASVFNGCARIYAPRYRQIILDTYDKGPIKGKPAWDRAYRDVAMAFKYFMAKYCTGKRPFILAGHSQGADHLGRLIKEYIDNNDEIKQRLVCAYLIGSQVGKDTFKTIPIASGPSDTSCFVSWCTTADKRTTSGLATGFINDKALAQLTKAPMSVNPLSWSTNNNAVDAKLNTASLYEGKLYTNVIGARCANGVKDKHGPGGGLQIKTDENEWVAMFMHDGDDYHPVDYELFWLNLRTNAELRVSKWLEKSKA